MNILSNRKYLLERKNPNSGYFETIIFTGNLKNRPTRYKLIKEIEN